VVPGRGRSTRASTTRERTLRLAVHGIGGITLHHNLWVDCDQRSPRLGDNFFLPVADFDVRNNVMYNWGRLASGLTGDDFSTNYVATTAARPSQRSRPSC
jgi:hypothetical protein